MPTLRLEPDEVLPTTPAPLEGEALGQFPIFWRGKDRQFWLRVVEMRPHCYLYFACQVEDEAAGNWLVYERDTFQVARWWVDSNLEEVPRQFGSGEWQLGRIFIFPGPAKEQSFRLLMGQQNIGAWLHKRFRSAAPFDLDLPLNICDSTRAQVQPYWQSALADPTSDICFAKHWLSLYPQQQRQLVLGECLCELEQIMQWVLQCQSILWERDNEWRWNLAPHSSGVLDLYPFNADDVEDFAAEFPFIWKMSAFLVEDYLSLLLKPWTNKHRCVRVFLESGNVWHTTTSQTPTAHERLEAALNLRDWLRKNQAPAELLALLNFNPSP